MSVIDALKDKADAVIGSTTGLREVGVDVLEKSSKNALDSYSYYSSVGIKQLRSLAAISDLNSARDFLGQSVSLGGELLKHAMDDLQKTMALGAEMRSSITDLLSGAAKATAESAARPKAAKGA